MANTTKYNIITGEPGIGKTTLIKNLVTSLATESIKTSGFYTEEVRRNGKRVGFDVVSLDGVRGRLARDETQLSGPVKHKVGKYGVLVQEFEDVALPCLEKEVLSSTQPHILVIDEIGKMEFFSGPFKTKIKDIFIQTSKIVLATISLGQSDTLIEKIRNEAAGKKVWTVTRENRNNIQEDILRELKLSMKLT